ncbi:radical SAM/SPASM domain-containing protein [Paenibacillus pseudetheri]|nr:radical SAM protein [Paenibacillus pseudetheri]
MKYTWNPTIDIQSREDTYLFINPEHGTWLKSKTKTKLLLEDMISGRNRNDISEHTKYSILQRFIESGMIIRDGQVMSTRSKKDIKSVYLVVTKTCNLSCDFCSMGSTPAKYDQLSTEEVKTAIDRLKDYYIGRIVITGGEPFSRRDILELVDYIHEKLSCKIVICTNGLLLNAEKIQQLSGKVSRIDMSAENIFSSVNKYDVHKLSNLIQNLRQHNISLCLSYVLTKQNQTHVFAFLDFIELTNTIFSLKIVGPIGNARAHKHLFFSSDSLTEAYSVIFRYIYRMGYQSEPFKRFLIQNLVPSYGCSARNKMLSIHVDKNVYSCHSLTTPEFSVGNIMEDTIDRILKQSSSKADSLFYKQSFEIDQRTVCADCNVRYFCQGSCYAEMYNNERRKGILPPECGIKKAVLIFNIWHYDHKQSFLDNLKVFIDLLESTKKQKNEVMR